LLARCAVRDCSVSLSRASERHVVEVDGGGREWRDDIVAVAQSMPGAFGEQFCEEVDAL
jgi:hypothetical protein